MVPSSLKWADFFLEVLRPTLQVGCRMMNEWVPTKDLALRKSSVNAVVIIQTESIWKLPGVLGCVDGDTGLSGRWRKVTDSHHHSSRG